MVGAPVSVETLEAEWGFLQVSEEGVTFHIVTLSDVPGSVERGRGSCIAKKERATARIWER